MSPMRLPEQVRSAIVIFETESGTTFQYILTPVWHQPVKVTLEDEVEYEFGRDILGPVLDSRHTYTFTLVAGEMRGQIRTPTGSATQLEPQAIEGSN